MHKIKEIEHLMEAWEAEGDEKESTELANELMKIIKAKEHSEEWKVERGRFTQIQE